MKVNDHVLYHGYVRGRGSPGGWRPYTWHGKVIKLNRVTADIWVLGLNDKWFGPWRVKRDRLDLLAWQLPDPPQD